MAAALLADMLAKIKLTEDYSCGYCLQKLPCMTDPRALPCSHVFCLLCLQQDSNTSGIAGCAICGKLYDTSKPENLKPVGLYLKLNQSGQSPKHQCSQCENPAIWFCTTCVKVMKLCTQHTKEHQIAEKYFEKKHDLIEITEYARAPRRYTLSFCKTHKEKLLTQGCTQCYTQFCDSCTQTESCGRGYQQNHNPHKMVTLDCFRKNLKAEYGVLLQELSAKVTEASRIDKGVWVKHDDMEEQAAKLMDEVDSATAEMISEIGKKSQKAKADIRNNLATSSETVKEFHESLEAKTRAMNDLQKDIHQHLQRRNDSDVINNFTSNKEKLKTMLRANFQECSFTQLELTRSGYERYGVQLAKHTTTYPGPLPALPRQQRFTTGRVYNY